MPAPMAPARSVETGGSISEKKESVAPKLAALLVSGDLGCIREALRELDRLTKYFGGKKENDYILDDTETQELLLDPNKSLKKVNALLKHEEFSQALVQLLTNDAFLSQPQALDRSDISTLLLLFRRLCKIPDFVSKLLTAGLVDALAAFFKRFRLWAQLMTPRELLRPHAEDFLTQRLSWFRETLALLWGLLESSSAFVENAARSELIPVLIRVWPPPGFEHSMYFTRRNINWDVANVSELLMCTLEAAGRQRPAFAPLFKEKRNEVAECFVRLMVWQRQRVAGSEDAHFPRWIHRTWGAFGALDVWRGARRKLVRKAHRLGTELLTAHIVPAKTEALVRRVLKELEAEPSGAPVPGRTEIDLSKGLPAVEHFLPRPTEVKKAAPRRQLSPAELASYFKSQEKDAVLRGVKELAVILQSCVKLLNGFVITNPLADWEGYEDAGLRGALVELLEGPLGDWLAQLERAEEAMTILVFIDVLNRGRFEESDQEDEQDAAMLRIVDWAVRRWRDLHPGVLWAALMLIGVYCTQSDACRLAAAQRGALQLGRNAVQLYRKHASKTARPDDARGAWVRDAVYKGWVLCDVILRTNFRDDEETAAKLREVARELGLARAAARAIVKGPAWAGLHVLAVLVTSTRDDPPGAVAHVWAKKGLVRALLELLLTAARLVDLPSDDESSSSGVDSDTGAPQSDGRAPRSDAGVAHADGNAPPSDGNAPHADGGPGHSDDSALNSDGGAADSDGPTRLPTRELRQLNPWEMRDFWADETPLWARARAACAQALQLLYRAVEGGAYLEFVRSGGVETVTTFLRRRDFEDERSVARMETMRRDDPELVWRLRAWECWSEAGGTAETLWGRAAAEAGLKKCPRVAKCRQRESMKGRFQQCGRRCGTFYCSRKCQATDWRAGHKKICVPAAASKPEA